MVMLLRRREWNVVHLVLLLLLYVVVIRREMNAPVSVVLSQSSVYVHRTWRQRVLLTPERLMLLVSHDEVVVRVGFRRCTGGTGDGTLNWTVSLIQVPGLGCQVVHAAPVR
jgi:hypothetical protein